MNPQLASLYVPRRPSTEQALEESNPPQEGGLAETSRLAPGVSASFRTSPFLSDPHKPDSPQSRDRSGRDVFGRRWSSTAHDMHDLHGDDLCGIEQSLFSRRDGVLGVPAASHPQPGRLPASYTFSCARLEGASRLSRLNSDPSQVRVRVCARTHAPVIASRNSRDSRDTTCLPPENSTEATATGVVGVHPPAGTPWDTLGHPTREVFAE